LGLQPRALKDQAELYRQYSDNPSFKKWLRDFSFAATYQAPEE
jgi:type I restriction enzyme R subunit